MSSLVFPMNLPGMTPKVTVEPYYRTTIQEAVSGKELRVSWWSYPRYKITLEFEFLRTYGSLDELHKMLSSLYRHLGKWDSFLISVPEDNIASAHPFGIGTGVKTAFFLQRSLVPDADLATATSRKYWPVAGDGYEPISDLNGAASIYVDGSLKTPTTDYTIGSSNGLVTVTFVSAPPNNAVLTWAGSYYKRVRLDDDQGTATKFVENFWETKTLKMVSVK